MRLSVSTSNIKTFDELEWLVPHRELGIDTRNLRQDLLCPGRYKNRTNPEALGWYHHASTRLCNSKYLSLHHGTTTLQPEKRLTEGGLKTHSVSCKWSLELSYMPLLGEQFYLSYATLILNCVEVQKGHCLL
jgi:hypothetical protein